MPNRYAADFGAEIEGTVVLLADDADQAEQFAQEALEKELARGAKREAETDGLRVQVEVTDLTEGVDLHGNPQDQEADE